MALQKSLVPVLFAGGLDTKSAKQLVVPGKFLVLENCIRRKLGRVEKRFGFEALGQGVVGADSIASGIRLARLNDDLVLMNSERIYSHSPANDNWIDKGPVSSVVVQSTPIVRNSRVQGMADIASTNGITVSIWESRGTSTEIHCAVFDETSGSAIVADETLSTNGSRPKVIAISGQFIMVYLEGNALKFVRLSASDPTQFFAEDDLVGSSVSATAPFDICQISVKAGLAYVTTGGQIKIAQFNYAGELGNGVNGMPTPITVGAVTDFTNLTCVNIVANPEDNVVHVAYHASTGAFANQVRVTATDTAFIASSSVAIETLAGVRNIGAAPFSGGVFQVFYEVSAASVKNHYVKEAQTTYTTTIAVTASAGIFLKSVGLLSKPDAVDGRAYVAVTHESTLQSTYFIARDDGLLVGKASPGLGGGLTRTVGTDAVPTRALQSGLTAFPCITGSTCSFVGPVTNRLQADLDGTVTGSAYGIQRFNIQFNAATLYSDQLGQNLHVGSGILGAYDGVSLTELGFNLFPEGISALTSNTASGAITSSGVYRVTAVYEWIDGFGQIHQSAPDTKLTVTMGVADDTISVIVPTLRLTSKTGDRVDVKIVVYRTIDGGIEVLYRDNEATNDLTVDAVSITLTQADSTLRTKAVLYTTGGILENIAPPSASIVLKHKNRLFLAGLEDVNQVAYSKEFVSGEGVAFSDAFILQVDPRGGPIKSLGVLDDKLIIFKEDRAFALSGDGPLDTGAQNDYFSPFLISGDTGCREQESIAITPNGLIFKSDKGIYLLDRSLTMQYVGSPVENYNSLNVTSSTILEDNNEVRFTTSDGQALIYNYFFDQWSTFTNYQAVSAINVLGAYHHLRSDGQVRRETQGYLDAGGKIKMAIETSWLAFANLQGYQRIYRYAFLGDFVSSHITRVKLAYDYEEAFTETVYFNVDTGLDLSYYGDDPTYGDSDVYGGSGSGVYQFSSKPRRQKCESMKFRIEDIDNQVLEGGGSFNLVGLTLEIGQKGTINKMRGSKRIGSL